MIFGIFYQEYEHFDTKTMRFTGEKYMDEALGSDAYHVLSRRACGCGCLSIWVRKMREQARKLSKVQPHYRGFKIMRGDILHATPVSNLIMI